MDDQQLLQFIETDHWSSPSPLMEVGISKEETDPMMSIVAKLELRLFDMMEMKARTPV